MTSRRMPRRAARSRSATPPATRLARAEPRARRPLVEARPRGRARRPDFDGIAIASSRIEPDGSVDRYRLNKSLRRAGFDTASLADDLGAARGIRRRAARRLGRDRRRRARRRARATGSPTAAPGCASCPTAPRASPAAARTLGSLAELGDRARRFELGRRRRNPCARDDERRPAPTLTRRGAADTARGGVTIALVGIRIEKVDLPGIGFRHDLVTEGGRRISVVSHRDGERDLGVFDVDDPDACRDSIPLNDDEAAALADVLGASVMLSRLHEPQRRDRRPLHRADRAADGLALPEPHARRHQGAHAHARVDRGHRARRRDHPLAHAGRTAARGRRHRGRRDS